MRSIRSNLKVGNITSLRAQQHYLLNLSIKLHEFGARLHWHTLSVHRLAGLHTFFSLSFTCCQGGQHEHNVSLFLCRPLSHALSVTGHQRRLRWGRIGSPWALRLSWQMSKRSWARWHNLLVGLRSADKLWPCFSPKNISEGEQNEFKRFEEVSPNKTLPTRQQDDGLLGRTPQNKSFVILCVCWQIKAGTSDFSIVNTRGT